MTAFPYMPLAMIGVIPDGTKTQTSILCGLAAIAAVLGYMAALASWNGPLHTFVLNIIRGWLATLYFVGYLYLLLADPDRGQWSQMMSGLGYAAWPVVWIYPLVRDHISRRRAAHIVSKSFLPLQWLGHRLKGRDAE